MAIRFDAELVEINSWTLIRLPQGTKLPSQGLVIARGTLNGVPLRADLEPDGKRGHWFRVDARVRTAAHLGVGDIARVVLEPVDEWPEPDVPEDLSAALAQAPQARAAWQEITPKARWDWLRWIRSTNNPQTRRRRIGIACSKLRSGDRRPCCFNRSICTEPDVSRGGVLLEPAQAKRPAGKTSGKPPRS